MYPSADHPRALQALRTIKAANDAGYRIEVLDDGKLQDFRAKMEELGANVHIGGLGMGAGRRFILQKGREAVGDDGVVCWLEPEKYTIIPDIEAIVAPILEGRADLVIPKRTPEAMLGHPLPQQLAEALGNGYFNQLLGDKYPNAEFDPWFGPFATNQTALQHFLNYEGEYGDRWDSIFIPRLRAAAAGLRLVSVVAENYQYPPEQRETEELGWFDMTPKRVGQLNNLVPALQEEAEKLGLISEKATLAG